MAQHGFFFQTECCHSHFSVPDILPSNAIKSSVVARGGLIGCDILNFSVGNSVADQRVNISLQNYMFIQFLMEGDVLWLDV